MIKAILFDIDGVLLDSRKANQKFLQDILKNAGYKKPSQEETDKVFHLTLWDCIKVLTREKSEGKIRQIWESSFQIRYPIEFLEITPGERPVIQKLSKNYQLALVTSRTKRGINIFYKATGLDGYFTVVVSFEDYTHPKPDPEPLLIALKRLKINPSEAVYVGDSETDLRAAKAIGMRFINFYFYSKRKFEEAEANIKNFTELSRVIRKL